MKRKKALKKQLKRLIRLCGHCPISHQSKLTNAIVEVSRELRKGKAG